MAFMLWNGLSKMLFLSSHDKVQSSSYMVSVTKTSAFSPPFDVTPAELITTIIAEKGIIKPNAEEIEAFWLRA
jgi:methylthioribose-1-phosphate isomerase